MAKVLVVEDEAAIADTLLFSLRSEGHEVQWLQLAQAALQAQQESPADVWLLDVGLPDIDGFEACRRLRQFSQVPVLFLTARDSEIDRVVGFEIGADDYVTKPFSPREVAARVRAILKRTQVQEPLAEPTSAQSCGVFVVDQARAQIRYREQTLVLTSHEWHLLHTLLAQPERVFSREQLLDAIGTPSHAGYERNIDSHIKTLRGKLRAVYAEGEPIQTHRGLGYSYQPERA
ncbi:two-component system, OmpR family, catabolic regulation response regulator CreB [Atopomonas hussainii]|uniref:Two-component system, OmpR family, catabolic regulation response regulator CreB n=1 Tax=Atopomonas hussainii TaxID=1429083 RepID=A0A1H7PIB1_9GAMM|nr:two-component system response regulator CreB [Atopomonas hussainii]SEL35218.1 two-component system, OmpR family, catabolic regulation response regulator CreB [Atopomonas hussainii]